MNISYPLLIDGGISNELESLGCNLNHNLWTAHLLDSDIDRVVKVHLNFLEAGAKCIATCGYQASMQGLQENGYSREESKQLIIKSVRAAVKARETYRKTHGTNTEILVAASIGPYGAYLADGSEYRGNYGLSKQELVDFHLERIEILEMSEADVLAFETIPDFTEIRAISEMLMKSSKPAWISFSCKDGKHISDGTSISNCVKFLSDHPNVFAIGANCIPPDLVPEIITQVKTNCKNKKVIIYPNSGGQYDSNGKKWYDNEHPFALKNHIPEWIQLGADIVGGCCKIGSNEIHDTSAVLNKIISD